MTGIQRQPNLFGEVVKAPAAQGSNVQWHRSGTQAARDAYAVKTQDAKCQNCLRRDWPGGTKSRCPRCSVCQTLSQTIEKRMRDIARERNACVLEWSRVANRILVLELQGYDHVRERIPNHVALEMGLDGRFDGIRDRINSAFTAREPAMLSEAVDEVVAIIEEVRRAS